MSNWPDELVDKFEKILKGGEVISSEDLPKLLHTKEGKSYGGIKTIFDLCKRLGISRAIRDKRRRFLVEIMIAGMLNSKSNSKNYIANEWVKLNAIEEVFGKQSYWNEDDLYETLDWLNKNQRNIEKKLLRQELALTKRT